MLPQAPQLWGARRSQDPSPGVQLQSSCSQSLVLPERQLSLIPWACGLMVARTSDFSREMKIWNSYMKSPNVYLKQMCGSNKTRLYLICDSSILQPIKIQWYSSRGLPEATGKIMVIDTLPALRWGCFKQTVNTLLMHLNSLPLPSKNREKIPKTKTNKNLQKPPFRH